MGAAHLLQQQDFAAPSPQAVAKVDIFNARQPVGVSIEAAQRQKRRQPDCAAASPEGGRLPMGVLVDVVVEQVLVLRQEVRCRRRVVVGAEARLQGRVSQKSLGR